MSSAGKKGSAAPNSSAEWISLAVAVTILLGFVAAILWLWIYQPTGPPQFKLSKVLFGTRQGSSICR
jgi:hypothetical protein